MRAALEGARETRTRRTGKFQVTFVEGSLRFCVPAPPPSGRGGGGGGPPALLPEGSSGGLGGGGPGPWAIVAPTIAQQSPATIASKAYLK